MRSHWIRRLAALAGLATVAVLALVVALPATAGPGYTTSSPPYVQLEAPAAGGDVVPLINSGETAYGVLFEGIPDGIGVKPGPGKNNKQGYIDLYVTHEQSTVPFLGFADFQDSSVTRVRVDVASKSITGMEVVLSPDLGYNRLCSAFMAGPEHGFPHHTFLVNEESNDVVRIPAGAPYGMDPSVAPYRQSGYAVYLDTVTGKTAPLASQGRHNHENTVIVPAWKKGIVALSGDDTFTTVDPLRPNLSQLYLSLSDNWQHFQRDRSTLYGFRVTGTGAPGPFDPADKDNGANDYLDIEPGDDWTGEFIRVPDDIARGTTGKKPQDALEDWSNENNVFQFVRVEDVAYDPDNPLVVYVADTGNSRLQRDPATGRLFRKTSSSQVPYFNSDGRMFKLVFNADDPLKVDSFSILAQGLLEEQTGVNPKVATTIDQGMGMRSPDNIDVGKNSLMVQEDTREAKIWQYVLDTSTWIPVATVDQDGDPATPESTTSPGESSGIVDVSKWFGEGWWAIDVQSHLNESDDDVGDDGPDNTWSQPAPLTGPGNGTKYTKRREDGQLLLMKIPGS